LDEDKIRGLIEEELLPFVERDRDSGKEFLEKFAGL